jgi:MFS family permease
MSDDSGPRRWYEGVTRYQWLVLVVASLGWVFDVFEGQIFVATMNEAMRDLLPPGAGEGERAFFNNIAFAAFLTGGALGGVVFGMLADRIGRTRAMAFTILFYSLFTCLSAFSQSWWQLAVFRFLVALGVGGEWAVASAFVAEVFPRHARAWSQSIFHASSVFGTLLAVAAGNFVSWRVGFLLGALPALLIIWIRLGLREPQRWVESQRAGGPSGDVLALFRPGLRQRTLVGVGLATVGLATFWGAHIYGKDALREAEVQTLAGWPDVIFLDSKEAEANRKRVLGEYAREIKQTEMLGMLLTTLGGGLGLVCFGPISEWLGRRGAFLLFQVGGLAATLVLFRGLSYHVGAIQLFLPLFGFLTLGMHAGYAVYFPELFPTHLRGTGGGFCFNVGRLTAAPILFLGGWMQLTQQKGGLGFSLADTASLLGLLFVPGMLLLLVAPETRGKELEE